MTREEYAKSAKGQAFISLANNYSCGQCSKKFSKPWVVPIRDVLAEVKPEHMTEEKYSDEWNYMDGWNGYEATMESKVKELGL